jgi:glycosyltransferase involved in cell wall biosynthesis
MNICFLTKYPPIEGGVSSTSYWFAKALGERGHNVHIITNAQQVENEYKEKIKENERHRLEPKNVKVHYLEEDFKSPILKSDYFTDRLSGLALKVIREYDIDIIYSFYLMPYGIAGMIAKFITGKPFIIRNAGSDVGRLYNINSLKPIFKEVLKNADWIHGAGGILRVLDDAGINRDKIVKFGHGTIHPDFNPKVKAFDFSTFTSINLEGKTIFTFIGKIQKIKGADKLIEALALIKNKNFLIAFVSGDDKEVEEIKKKAHKKGIINKCVFIDFQAPWKIPSIINASDCVVLPENSEFPMLPEGVHYPIIGRESFSCAKCVIMGKGIAKRGYYKMLKHNENILIVDPEDIKDFSEKLKIIIDKPGFRDKIGSNALKFSKKIEKPEVYYKKVSDFFNSLNN